MIGLQMHAKADQGSPKKRQTIVETLSVCAQKGFDPKVKSPKMGLPITLRQLSKRPILLRDIWPQQGPNICKQGRKNIKNVLVTLFQKLNFQAVIKSAASAASPTAWGAPRAVVRIPFRRPSDPVVPPSPVVRRSPSRRRGCASSRLDHGLKVKLPKTQFSES